MSLVNHVPEKGRVYVRRFDHEEAAARRAAGERVADLAAEYGVTIAAIYAATTPGQKQKQTEYLKRWRTGECESCGGPAMRLVGTKRLTARDGRILCVRCRADVRRERLRFDAQGVLLSVRCSSEDCANGERWQPPENFARGSRHREVREGGIHGSCRACITRAKRAYRNSHSEYNERQNALRRQLYKERRRNGEAVTQPRGPRHPKLDARNHDRTIESSHRSSTDAPVELGIVGGGCPVASSRHPVAAFNNVALAGPCSCSSDADVSCGAADVVGRVSALDRRSVAPPEDRCAPASSASSCAAVAGRSSRALVVHPQRRGSLEREHRQRVLRRSADDVRLGRARRQRGVVVAGGSDGCCGDRVSAVRLFDCVVGGSVAYDVAALPAVRRVRAA